MARYLGSPCGVGRSGGSSLSDSHLPVLRLVYTHTWTVVFLLPFSAVVCLQRLASSEQHLLISGMSSEAHGR